MKFFEYGKQNAEKAVLLHGGGLSWWSCREAAELLQSRFHVIIPILDGHSGSDRDFTTIEDNAAEIIGYIDENFGGSVKLVCGLSLGGQILTEMLSQRGDICEYAVIESALVIPMKMTHLLVGPMLDMSYGLIKKKWFSKLQFRELKIKEELYEEYYRDSCAVTKENMTAFLKANSCYTAKGSLRKTSAKVFIFAGQREQRKILLSAKRLNNMISGSSLRIFKGYYHGELSINHAPEYAKIIIEAVK